MKSHKRPRENSTRMPGNSMSPTPRGFEGTGNSPYGPGAWGHSDPTDRNQEVPLLRIHVLSARGLPRSSGAVGMPDPYVVVRFNQEKVTWCAQQGLLSSFPVGDGANHERSSALMRRKIFRRSRAAILRKLCSMGHTFWWTVVLYMVAVSESWIFENCPHPRACPSLSWIGAHLP